MLLPFVAVVAIALVVIPSRAVTPAGAPLVLPTMTCTSGYAGNITVPGNGLASARADVARVDLTVVVTEKTASEARNEAAGRAEAVFTAIRRIPGIFSENVTTTSINIAPETSYNDTTNTRTVTGYVFSNGINVAISNLSDTLLASVLDAAVQAGQNNLTIDNLAFDLSDQLSYERTVEAREQASRDARATAEQYSSNFGMSLGRLLTIVDNTQAATPTTQERTITRTGSAGGTAASTPVSIGTVPVSVSITVTFGLC